MPEKTILESPIHLIERERRADLLSAAQKLLSGYQHAAKAMGYPTEGANKIELEADERQISSKVFDPKGGKWETDTALLGTWKIEIDLVDGSIGSPADYVVTLRHIPPKKEVFDLRSFKLEFAVEKGKGASSLKVIKTEQRLDDTTIVYGIKTLNQIGGLLSSLSAGSEPAA